MGMALGAIQQKTTRQVDNHLHATAGQDSLACMLRFRHTCIPKAADKLCQRRRGDALQKKQGGLALLIARFPDLSHLRGSSARLEEERWAMEVCSGGGLGSGDELSCVRNRCWIVAEGFDPVNIGLATEPCQLALGVVAVPLLGQGYGVFGAERILQDRESLPVAK